MEVGRCGAAPYPRPPEPLPTHAPLSGEGWKPASHRQLKEPSMLTQRPPRHRSVTAHSSTSRIEAPVSRPSPGARGPEAAQRTAGERLGARRSEGSVPSWKPEAGLRGGALELRHYQGQKDDTQRVQRAPVCRRHGGEAPLKDSECLPDTWLPVIAQPPISQPWVGLGAPDFSLDIASGSPCCWQVDMAQLASHPGSWCPPLRWRSLVRRDRRRTRGC